MKPVHVVFNSMLKRWEAFERMGNDRKLIESGEKKTPVLDAAIEYAKSIKGELFIHKQNGEFQDRRSYGSDPRGNG